MPRWTRKLALAALTLLAAAQAAHAAEPGTILLTADRVWTGEGQARAGWAVLVENGRIKEVGPADKIGAPPGAERIALPGKTLIPGLIDLHSHVLLHPYNETTWDDQVIKEQVEYRTLLAGKHAKDTLQAGFTTLRDLGTEGANYADVGIKRAIEQGVIEGPRLLIATKAIVASFSYGPAERSYRPDMEIPYGAQEATGIDEVTKAVREQASHGADWIKFYADYRTGVDGTSRPTFTLEEMKAMVAAAHVSGRKVAAHASTDEAIRMAVLAGADTLLDTLRPMLVIGQRGASPAPWLLLLELLLLTNREKQFEEAAMDYCVTYEVSPPSFEAPLRVSTAAPAPGHGDRFMLPSVMSGPDSALLTAIDAYAQERETLVLDCSRLARIDYAGAGSLLARLDAHGAAGRTVELRELNHLVTTLLRLLGAGDGVRLYPHRY